MPTGAAALDAQTDVSSTTSTVRFVGVAVADADHAQRHPRKRSAASRLLVRRVAVMKHQVVAVGVREVGHETDSGVERFPIKLDALRFEFPTRLLHVVNVESKMGALLRSKFLAEALRLPDVQACLACPKLKLAVLIAA